MEYIISVTFLIVLGFANTCLAKVDIASTKPMVIPVDNVTPKLTSADVAKVIPLDRGIRDTGTMMSRIADRSFNLWFSSETVQESLLGRVVQETQETLKTDVEVPASDKHGISHKFSFRVECFQALAKLEYKGWLNAAINYNARDAQTDIEVKEKVFVNKDLIFSHKGSSKEGLSMVGLAWQW
ncbi:MAG: hypothetical protein ACKOX6_06235 [Bdellovibrio sp.]